MENEDVHAGVSKKFNFKGTRLSIKTLLEAIKQKKKYIQLDDGSIGILPEEWIAKFNRTSSIAELVTENNSESLRFTPIQAHAVEALFDETEQAKADEKFKEYLVKINSFKEIEQKEIPQEFQNVLRPYQEFGFNWLYFLF